MEGTTSLEEGLVDTAATSNDADGGSAGRLEDLFRARGELDTGHSVVDVVANDGCVVARGPGEGATVTHLFLNVANDGSLWHGGEGKDVSDVQRGLFAAVDKLARVHAFGSDESLRDEAVLVGIAKDDARQGSTSTGVVDDLLDEATDVSGALGVVNGTELSGALASLCVSAEDGRLALSLSLSEGVC